MHQSLSWEIPATANTKGPKFPAGAVIDWDARWNGHRGKLKANIISKLHIFRGQTSPGSAELFHPQTLLWHKSVNHDSQSASGESLCYLIHAPHSIRFFTAIISCIVSELLVLSVRFAIQTHLVLLSLVQRAIGTVW